MILIQVHHEVAGRLYSRDDNRQAHACS